MTIELPQILTVKSWNAKKGVIAKMAGETGIGAALTKLKVEFDKMPTSIEPIAAGVTQNTKLLEIDRLTELAKTTVGSAAVGNVRSQLTVVIKLTKKTALAWKKSKVIPKSSVAHVELMTSAADGLFDRLNWLNLKQEWLTARHLRVKREQETAKVLKEMIKTQIAAVREAGNALLEDPKAAKFDSAFGKNKKGFHSLVRGFGAILAKIKDPDWVIPWHRENWYDFAQMGYQPAKGKDGEVRDKVNAVLVKLSELENRLPA